MIFITCAKTWRPRARDYSRDAFAGFVASGVRVGRGEATEFRRIFDG